MAASRPSSIGVAIASKVNFSSIVQPKARGLTTLQRIQPKAIPNGSAINKATVRVTPFDPFSISVGKHELQVTLVDTPGYGEFVNTEASFEVIGRYVEVRRCRPAPRPSALTPSQPPTLTST